MAKQGGSGAKKHGRNKEKCKRYTAHNTKAKNKTRRVLRSSGFTQAKAYAGLNGTLDYLAEVVRKQALMKGKPHDS